MDPITCKIEKDRLTLFFHGRVDSSSAGKAGEIIDRALAESDAQDVVMDFDDLEYISSAGLRLILKVRKQRPGAHVTSVSTEIYSVLAMTGFTEMLPVEKAFRKISLDDCELLAKGANGAVYRLDQDTILKVSLHDDGLADINRERELSRRAFILGVPTAIPYDVVKAGDHYGAVYELLDCMPLGKMLSEHPENLNEYAKIFVGLLKTVHAVEALPGELPSQKKEVLGWVDFLKDHLPERTWIRLRELVEAVPEDSHLMHGDFHARNVMIQNGEPLLIDMDTLCQGNPVFEFASIFNAYKGFSILDEKIIWDFMKLRKETSHAFLRKIFSLYFETEDPESLQKIEDKSALLGYTRLLRRSIRRDDASLPKTQETQKLYKEEICRLADKLDRLTF